MSFSITAVNFNSTLSPKENFSFQRERQNSFEVNKSRSPLLQHQGRQSKVYVCQQNGQCFYNQNTQNTFLSLNRNDKEEKRRKSKNYFQNLTEVRQEEEEEIKKDENKVKKCFYFSDEYKSTSLEKPTYNHSKQCQDSLILGSFQLPQGNMNNNIFQVKPAHQMNQFEKKGSVPLLPPSDWMAAALAQRIKKTFAIPEYLSKYQSKSNDKRILKDQMNFSQRISSFKTDRKEFDNKLISNQNINQLPEQNTETNFFQNKLKQSSNLSSKSIQSYLFSRSIYSKPQQEQNINTITQSKQVMKNQLLQPLVFEIKEAQQCNVVECKIENINSNSSRKLLEYSQGIKLNKFQMTSKQFRQDGKPSSLNKALSKEIPNKVSQSSSAQRTFQQGEQNAKEYDKMKEEVSIAISPSLENQIKGIQKEITFTAEEKLKYQNRSPRGYDKLELIGKGGFSAVWLCKGIKSGIHVAAKQICKSNKESSDRELNFLKTFYDEEGKLRSKFVNDKRIQRLIGLIEIQKDAKDTWIIYELGGSNISKSLMKLKGDFYEGARVYRVNFTDQYFQLFKIKGKENTLVNIIKSVAEGLELLSSCKLSHFDIKPENILVNPEDLTVKLIDFGSAILFSEARGQISTITLEYMPPEVISVLLSPISCNDSSPLEILASKSNFEAIDVWSLGVTLLEVLTGLPHWLNYKCAVTYQKQTLLRTSYFATKNQDLEKLLEKQKAIGNHLQNIFAPVMPLFNSNSKAQQLLNLISLMLKYNSQERIKPSQILQHPFLQYSTEKKSNLEVNEDDDYQGEENDESFIKREIELKGFKHQQQYPFQKLQPNATFNPTLTSSFKNKHFLKDNKFNDSYFKLSSPYFHIRKKSIHQIVEEQRVKNNNPKEERKGSTKIIPKNGMIKVELSDILNHTKFNDFSYSQY